MAVAADSYAQRILEVQACSNGGCACQQALRRGHGLTHCFIHNDPGPSLNVSVKSGELLVHCQAGCDQRALVAQLRDQDMFPPATEAPTQRAAIVAEYDYVDEQGTLVFQALRYHPKAFKQRRPDSSGGWLWNLNGVRQVPYRLPEILSNPDRLVFVAEGEKDVDRLRAEGFLATCNAGGAGKWTAEHASHLTGRRVVIVVDNDEPGRAHGHKVARSLQGIAQSVQWLELPGLQVKGDVSDWFDAGHTADELKDLVRSAGPPPVANHVQTKDVFARDGLGYRYQAPGSDLVMRFTKVIDRTERMPAEFEAWVPGQPMPFIRRAVNLTAATGFPDNIARMLERESAGAEVNWEQELQRAAEMVIQAARNGLVLRMVGGDIERPPSAAWLCEDLVLKDKLNCWLGTGSTGKSTLAKMLATYCRLGRDFIGRRTMKCQSLYLDWEDDEADFGRVVVDVCRSLGVWPAPEIGWVSMKGKRLRDNLESIGRYIEQLDAKLLIIDAIAAAGGAGGDHKSWEDIALELDACVGQLPAVTVLGLDHATGDDHKNQRTSVPVKARGSERKYEIYRNQWSLVADQSRLEEGRHVVNWYHTKLNSGPRRKPFVVEILHEEEGLDITEQLVSASPEAMARLTDIERAVAWLKGNPGSSVDQICDEIFSEKSDQKKVDSLRRQLDRQMKKGRIERDAARFYWPAGHPDKPTQLSGPLSGDLP